MKRWLVSISVMLLRRDLVDVGQETARSSWSLSGSIHRQVDLEIGHHLVEVVPDFGDDPLRQRDLMLRPRRRIVTFGSTAVTIVADTASQVDPVPERDVAPPPRGANAVQLKRLRERCVEARSR